jgi:Outer membrane lipoprotein-sorting protein
MGTAAPPERLEGRGVLNFRYVSPDVPDDTYMYLPDLRKVRRLAASNRSDAFWGTDIDIDSNLGMELQALVLDVQASG